MSRSIKKGPYVDERVINKLKNAGPGQVIKTWLRACVISPEMVGFTFGVYNGKQHLPVKVSEEMVGHRLGEFAPTRKFTRHGGRMAREQEAEVMQKEANKVKSASEDKEAKPVQKVGK